MTLGRWVFDFCLLHERVKQGTVTPDERVAYIHGREDLAATLLVAQRIALGGKAGSRLAIRVTQAHPVEVENGGTWVKAVTQDIAVGGLSTILATAPPADAPIAFRLKLNRSTEPLVGHGRVVYVHASDGSAKVAVRFDDLADSDRVRLEDAVFDAVVGQLRLLPRRPI